VNMWYTSGSSQKAEKLWENGCPQLQEGIDCKTIGLKQYRGLVMPFS
jgi:hypothetical protein